LIHAKKTSHVSFDLMKSENNNLFDEIIISLLKFLTFFFIKKSNLIIHLSPANMTYIKMLKDKFFNTFGFNQKLSTVTTSLP
jgi:hypothetical protein